MNENRPNPDDLLEVATRDSRERGRGHLKIYLGMAAGVGKTYAMLQDAHVAKKSGDDIVAGYIEPHGRFETETLVSELAHLEPKTIEYRGITLREFDLDGAITRNPQIILIDELAHTNAPGSRHIKRWQDIEELLAKGIDVWTTLNIQHIESLRDVVSQVTGVEVQETVPDGFISGAHQIELVDIPPEDLIDRINAGKVYAPDKVDHALRNFFQENTLTALREIVLRHAADTVDAQLRSLRGTAPPGKAHAAKPRVVVAVGPNGFAQRLVRAAARLARRMHGDFVVLTIEAPVTATRGDEYGYLDKAMGLAERLGGDTIRRTGHDIVAEILNLANEQSAQVIVVGKPVRARIRDFVFGSIVDDLIRRSGDIDVYVVSGGEEEGGAFALKMVSDGESMRGVVATVLTIAAATLLCFAMFPYFALSNLIMVYLVAVAAVASRFGRIEAVIASVTSVLAYDFFFVPPRFTFAVADMQYFITFILMLIVALGISTLTLRVRAQSKITADRERKTSLLLRFSRLLSSCRSHLETASVVERTFRVAADVDAVLFWPEGESAVSPVRSTPSRWEEQVNELAVAEWVSTHGVEAGRGTSTLPGAKAWYIPLLGGELRAPVLGVVRTGGEVELSRQEREVIEAFADLLSVSLVRISLESQATDVRLRAEREELKNILLSSVSHDLRTPLTTVIGAANLLLTDPSLNERNKQLASSIAESSTRLSMMVRNVLDLTRLESGKVVISREWHSLEELVGTALERTNSLLGPRKVEIRLQKDLPLISVDGLLFEQVLVNLLENAAKYTPTTACITIVGESRSGTVVLEISDNGPGLKAGTESQIFDKLVRGDSSQGFGLGLAVCRAIVDLHGGTIVAHNLPSGGATFQIALPALEAPPEVLNG